MRDHLVRFAIVASLILSMLVLVSAVSVSAAEGREVPSSYELLGSISHSVIRIDSDLDLQTQAAAESWSGTGSASDPYVIENYDIYAAGKGNAIFVGNTTLHLIIRNCSLHDAGFISSPYRNGAGLMVLGSQNITVRDSSMFDNYVSGIMLQDSRLISMINNTLANKLGLFDSDWNFLSDNTISFSGDYGLYLSGSNHNSISNNTISASTGIHLRSYSGNNILLNNDCSNTSVGIHLYELSQYNTISYNDCSGCSESGIFLEYLSYHNSLAFNDCSGNGVSGIDVSASYNTVNGNNCTGNGGQGINVTSWYNTITENDCRSNNYGIRFPVGGSNNNISYNDCDQNVFMGIIFHGSGSYSNVIAHNHCSGNNVGIYLGEFSSGLIHNNTCDLGANGITIHSNSDSNTISNNSCEGNTIGIYVLQSFNNTIVANLCRDNYDGIYACGYDQRLEDNVCLGNTRHGIITHNSLVLRNNCSDNGDSGINLYANWVSFYSTLAENTCQNNTYGIRVESSYDNVLFDNTCSSNKDTGILLQSSGRNELYNNTCELDQYGIRLLSSSKMNWIAGNTCVKNAYYGVHLHASDANILEDNTCDDNALAGIRVDSSSNNTLAKNTCAGNWHGIDIGLSDNNFIYGNHCDDNTEHGIYLDHSCSNTLANNSCSGNLEHGIHLDYSCDNQVLFNHCEENNRGIVLRFFSDRNLVQNNSCLGNNIFGIYLMYSSNDNEVFDNVGEGNGNSGLYLYESSNNHILGNHFNFNDLGICTYDSHSNTISNNALKGNFHHGIFLESSGSNLLFGNVLIGNNGATTVYRPTNAQAYDDGTNLWNSSSHGNYWEDWCTPDQNADGIVDVAYDIAGGSGRDHLPIFVGMDITSPSSGTYTSDPQALLQGSATSFLGISSMTWFNAASGASGLFFGNTSWNCIVTLLEGDNHITVTMVDGGGVERNGSITLLLDTIAPAVEVLSPTDGSYNNTRTITVVWTAIDEGSGIDHYNVSANGMDWFTTDDETYTFTSITDGVHTIIVSAHDQVGNHGDITIVVTVDTAAPALSIGCPVEGAYNNTGNISIIWTGEDDGSGISHYIITVDGQGPQHLTSNITHYDLSDLADGPHLVNITAADLAGNLAWGSVEFIVDTVSPVLVMNTPMEGHYYNSSSGQADWTVMDTSPIASTAIRLDGGEWEELWDITEWQFSSLTEGGHTLEIVVTDQAGNVDSMTIYFIVDTLAPTVAGSPIGEGVGLGAFIGVQFSEHMDPDSVTISIEGVIGTLVLYETSAMFIPSVDLTPGHNYTVVVFGRDLAGNSMTMSWTFATVYTNGSVLGKVTDGSGAPLSGAAVMLGEVRACLTGPEGEFLFEGVKMGNYTLTIHKAVYRTRSIPITVNASQATDIGELELTAMLGSVEGKVVDRDGNPIPAADVSLDGWYETVTDADGRFSFGNVTVGDRTLTVVKSGYQPLVSSIAVSDGETEDLGDLMMDVISGGGEEDDGDSPIMLILLVVLVIIAASILVLLLWRMKRGR